MSGIEPLSDEHCHNDNVDKKNAGLDRGGEDEEFVDLKGKIDAAGDYSQPLGPSAATPEAPCFHEADRCVAESTEGQKLQTSVIGLGGNLKEDAGNAVCGVQVKVPHDFLGQGLHIPVNEGEESEPGRDDEGSLGCFQKGDSVQR